MAIKCNCHHEFQDQFYGAGMRYHNYARKVNGWRCTVCKSVKPNQQSNPEKAQ